MSRTNTISPPLGRHLIVALAVAVAGGCEPDGPPRGAVQGKVTLGGQPLPRGRILFRPQNPPGPLVTAVIEDGRYQLAADDGPLVGQNRVEIEGDRDLGFAMDDEQAYAERRGAPLPPNPIPSQYRQNSMLTTEIREGENVYDVDIPRTQPNNRY